MGFEITWEPPRGAFKRFYGVVNGDEIMQSVVTIESDPRFDDLRYVINDFLGVSDFEVSEESIRMVSATDWAASLTNSNIKIAVVTTDPRMRALAELYATSHMNAYPTRIFEDMGEARTWAISAA